MAISTKVITMRQGNKSDYQPSKMLSGELAVINDAEELHFSPKTGKSIRVATENDLKEVGNTVDDALSETSINPVQNKVVTAKFNELSGQISDLQQGGSGVTTAMSQSLWAIMQKTAFATPLTDAELSAFKTAWGIEGGGEEEPDEPVTLTSISATYSGGSVLVGTSVNALTGITVKANYSDGTSKTVTGYTVSGTIKEGSNTITISYGGKSTTITVIGYVENEPEITLTSISATYVGGDVPVGTALTDLTGITVTGTYSDGSTSTITGYTLSGTIAEGSNTITVTYQGKTATFKVTGIAESTENNEIELTWIDGYSITSGTIKENPNWSCTELVNCTDISIIRVANDGASNWLSKPNVYGYVSTDESAVGTAIYNKEGENYIWPESSGNVNSVTFDVSAYSYFRLTQETNIKQYYKVTKEA